MCRAASTLLVCRKMTSNQLGMKRHAWHIDSKFKQIHVPCACLKEIASRIEKTNYVSEKITMWNIQAMELLL